MWVRLNSSNTYFNSLYCLDLDNQFLTIDYRWLEPLLKIQKPGPALYFFRKELKKSTSAAGFELKASTCERPSCRRQYKI